MTPEQYDAWYDTPRGRWIGDAEYRLMLRLLGDLQGKTVLDVGCGTGWFTRRLAAEAAQVVGLDCDEGALAFARRRGPGRVQYVRGDAANLPFADHSFDAVLSVTALCFVELWPRALAEIARVSRQRFALGLLNRHSLLWLDKGRAGGQGGYRGAYWHTRPELDAVLCGLQTFDMRYGYAIFFPSGSKAARAWESWLPSCLPLGAFMAVGARVGR